MAKKQKINREADKAPEAPAEEKPGVLGDGREPRIVKKEGSTFDERTKDLQPFIQDGEQVTGEGDSTEADKLETPAPPADEEVDNG